MTDILSTPPSAQAYAEEERRRGRNAEMSQPGRKEVEEHNRRVMAQAGDRLMASTTSVAPEPAAPVGSHPPVPVLAERGDIGQAVVDLLRFDRIEAARTRCVSRVVEEERTLVDEAHGDALDAQIDEYLSAAWSAATKKERVPALLDPIIRWDAHERVVEDRRLIGKRLRTAIDDRAVSDAQDAVAGALDSIDELVVREALGAADDAVQAAERLTLAGLDVDADAGALVDRGDDGALSALRLWRAAVVRWERVQAVRMWCAAALDRGLTVSREGSVCVVPPPRMRSGEWLSEVDRQRANAPQAEVRTQGSAQWQGSAPSWLAGRTAHEVLRWYVRLDAGDRPVPRGVADLDDVIGADRG